jgi:hypothetical protein
MIAPNYAPRRSELARSLGLERKAAAAPTVTAPETKGGSAAAETPKTRGRAEKAA